jgi:6,7-dimethyl-8-ribityllumazine synthase
MVKVIEANLMAKGKRFGIVASRFNDFITKDLVNGCLDTLLRHGANEDDISLTWVPGAFEIPLLNR